MRGVGLTINLDGVRAWRPERRSGELERRLARMAPDYQAAAAPALAEQREGEAELAELNAPLQEAWQREREAAHRRTRRHLVAHAISAAIAKATAQVGRHRRASGSSTPRRRGSRRSSSDPDDGSGEAEPARRRGHLRGDLVAAAELRSAA